MIYQNSDLTIIFVDDQCWIECFQSIMHPYLFSLNFNKRKKLHKKNMKRALDNNAINQGEPENKRICIQRMKENWSKDTNTLWDLVQSCIDSIFFEEQYIKLRDMIFSLSRQSKMLILKEFKETTSITETLVVQFCILLLDNSLCKKCLSTAQELHSSITKSQPTNSNLNTFTLIIIGTQLRMLKRYDAVINHYNQHKLGVYSNIGLGDVYSKKKMYKEAVEEYSNALNMLSDDHLLYFKRGKAHIPLKNYRQSYLDIQKALQLANGNFTYIVAMGRLHSHQQEYNQAIKYYSDALVIDSNNTFVYILRSKCYSRLGLQVNAYKDAIAAKQLYGNKTRKKRVLNIVRRRSRDRLCKDLY
jgi:tetratricopeptide (TPR) repeat protein